MVKGTMLLERNKASKANGAMTRSPLKFPPLRIPGQSLDEELQQLYSEKVLPYFLYPGLFIGYAVGEWGRWYFHSPPIPWIVTAIAFVSILFSIYQIRNLRPKIHALKLGRDGERAVGQSLEELRTGGAIVLHDILADGFNVDHVVIAPQGIFVIETKTYSKPNGRDAKVLFDGAKLSFDGRVPDRDPVKQARANTSWVLQLLKDMTDKSYPARPVVLFPGWFVETVGAHAHDHIWVLNPKGLPAFIAQEKATLSVEDIKSATCHLSRYIRNL